MFKADTSIVTLVERYVAERDVSSTYAGHLRRAAIHLERWAGQTVMPSDLSECFLCEFLAELQQGNRTNRTVNNYRQCVLTIWTYAADLGLCHQPVYRRVRRCKAIAPVVTAFSPADVAGLAVVSRRFKWPVIPGPTFDALIRLGWDSGYRLSDCLGLRPGDIADGYVNIVVGKTGRPLTRRLRPSTLAVIEATNPENRTLIFPWALRREQFYIYFKRICRAAGLSGGFRYLRRGGATACECQQRGSAAEFLGHVDGGAVARASYIDARLLPAAPMPPELG